MQALTMKNSLINLLLFGWNISWHVQYPNLLVLYTFSKKTIPINTTFRTHSIFLISEKKNGTPKWWSGTRTAPSPPLACGPTTDAPSGYTWHGNARRPVLLFFIGNRSFPVLPVLGGDVRGLLPASHPHSLPLAKHHIATTRHCGPNPTYEETKQNWRKRIGSVVDP